MQWTGASPRPPKSYAISRGIRLFLFSFVVATLVVSVGLVAFQFVYNEIAELAGLAPYQMRVELIVPAIVLVTILFMRVIHDASQGTGRRA